MSRRREPRPVSGAQIDAPETTDQRHLVETPNADAPTQILDASMPGSQAGAKKEEGGVWVRTGRLFREGLRPSNLVSAYGRTPLVLLMVLGTIGIFGNAINSVALPEIQKDLEINIRFLITLSSWIGLMAVLIGLPFGFLGDRRKRVPLYGVGSLLGAISEIIFGLANGKGMLAGSRIVGTIGSLGPNSVGYSLLADYVPPEYRGRSFAFRQSAYAFIGIIAPLAGGFIARSFGWRIPFIVFGALTAVLSLVFLRMPEPIRGYFERKAFGADEETARRQQEPPSFGEALRAAWGDRKSVV